MTYPNGFFKFSTEDFDQHDPGKYQQLLAADRFPQPGHDLLFSISELAGKYSASNCINTPPCVYLNEWPFVQGSSDAPWTTVTHWWDNYPDSKREGFLPFMSIPSKVRARFELASNIGYKEEQEKVESYGFTLRDPYGIVSTTSGYRTFIQESAGEFSCA